MACAMQMMLRIDCSISIGRGFAREWPTETVRGSQRADCLAGVVGLEVRRETGKE